MWGSVRLYFLMFLCRLSLQMCGNDSQIPLQGTLFMMRINSWLHRTQFTLGAAEDLMWHKQLPLKVSIFVCRLLRNRLPTKTNLVTRGIISPEHHFCMAGCGGIESAQHLFLSCSTFGSLWPLVRSWIDFSAVGAQTIFDHFVQFTHLAGGLRARRSFLQLI
jgi:hypothetical protein